jgi:DNA-binding HxlR family transcriptional regulator
MKQAMDNPVAQLNKVFDSRIRIGIMSALMVSESVNFNELKGLIDVTDGNLATHIKTLEEHKYIQVQKGFIGRKTNTTYSITQVGEKAFRAHLDALETIIKSLN